MTRAIGAVITLHHMPTHQSNTSVLPDELFVPGEFKHLAVGNECRLLDRRRTPGKIIAIEMDGGFFRWEISDFEDKGKFWDVIFERVSAYQFNRESAELSIPVVKDIEACIQRVAELIHIKPDAHVAAKTNKNIKARTDAILIWLNQHSEFFKSETALDFQNRLGPVLLRSDFNKYMASVGLDVIERQTADIQVLNPHSGDWIKATQIVMAEMGLKDYHGSQIRTDRVFDGIGSKQNRRLHI